MTRALRRALPATYIDLIRDGVPKRDLASWGGGAIWNALVRCSTSAQQRGWSQPELAALILEPASALGRQLATTPGGKSRTKRAVDKQLVKAWDAATKWLMSQPPPITRAAAIAHCEAARDLCGDADNDLTDAERAALGAATSLGLGYGTDRPALPRKAWLEASGLGLTALRTATRGLEAKGLLRLEVRGTPRGPKARRGRANLYRIGGPEQIQAYLTGQARSVGPQGQPCSAPPTASAGAPSNPVVPLPAKSAGGMTDEALIKEVIRRGLIPGRPAADGPPGPGRGRNGSGARPLGPATSDFSPTVTATTSEGC